LRPASREGCWGASLRQSPREPKRRWWGLERLQPQDPLGGPRWWGWGRLAGGVCGDWGGEGGGAVGSRRQKKSSRVRDLNR
jgi:hypothetical protein